MIPSDTVLLVLKYAGSTVAGAYGVYATVTNFKEQKNGKQVLSQKGYWGIALLLVSILINTTSDGFKDIRERREANVQQRQRVEAASALQHVSDQLSTELERTTDLNTQLAQARNDVRRTLSMAASALGAAAEAADPFEPAMIHWGYVYYTVPKESISYEAVRETK